MNERHRREKQKVRETEREAVGKRSLQGVS
jgi:hypothetical protein